MQSYIIHIFTIYARRVELHFPVASLAHHCFTVIRSGSRMQVTFEYEDPHEVLYN